MPQASSKERQFNAHSLSFDSQYLCGKVAPFARRASREVVNPAA
jgi:hypothetical protein